MENATANKQSITIQNTINAPVEKVWKMYNGPEHVTQWNCASDDWHSPRAENDLRAGGKFSYRMEARDGSMGFDFAGVYDEVKTNETIRYTLGDGRKATVQFVPKDNATLVTVSFDPESTNPIEMQKAGWQSILDNFKKYVEKLKVKS